MMASLFAFGSHAFLCRRYQPFFPISLGGMAAVVFLGHLEQSYHEMWSCQASGRKDNATIVTTTHTSYLTEDKHLITDSVNDEAE